MLDLLADLRAHCWIAYEQTQVLVCTCRFMVAPEKNYLGTPFAIRLLKPHHTLINTPLN